MALLILLHQMSLSDSSWSLNATGLEHNSFVLFCYCFFYKKMIEYNFHVFKNMEVVFKSIFSLISMFCFSLVRDKNGRRNGFNGGHPTASSKRPRLQLQPQPPQSHQFTPIMLYTSTSRPRHGTDMSSRPTAPMCGHLD